MRLEQKPTFKRAYKKLHANQKTAVDAVIRTILADPSRGIEKIGDLAGIRVHKFTAVKQQWLLAYQTCEAALTLLALGTPREFPS